MALTRDYKQTIRERAQRDPDFAALLMNEAVTNFLAGEPDTARVLRRFRAVVAPPRTGGDGPRM